MGRMFAWPAAVALVGSGAARGQEASEPKADGPAPVAVQASEASPVAEVDESRPVEVPVPSEKAMTFYRTGMRFWAFNRIWAIALPAVILFSGASARIRNVASGRGRWGWFSTVALYVPLYLLLVAVVQLPIDYYLGYVRLHAYGLSNQTLGKWSWDHFVSLAVDAGVAVLVAWGAYGLLRLSPRRWWLWMSLASIPFLLLGVLIKPLWIDPLFNDFGPMKDKALERSILDLADRAGIASSRVFEVDKSVDTKAVNAYVTGFLGSKRIVLWDTLLQRLNEREVLFVMAHEMGHYVLGHVVRSVFLSFAVTLVGLYFVHRLAGGLIARFRGRFGFDELRDAASVPLIVMLLQVATLFLSPVAMAYSRYQEHEADRFAIDLTRMNHSGGTAFTKLQAENLGNPRPGWVYRVFRASHPSIGDRIDFCNTYRPEGGAAAAGRGAGPLGTPGG